MRDDLEVMAITVLFGGQSIEIVHVTVTYLQFFAGAAGEPVKVALVSVRVEGHDVAMVATFRLNGFTGNRDEVMVAAITAGTDDQHAA